MDSLVDVLRAAEAGSGCVWGWVVVHCEKDWKALPLRKGAEDSSKGRKASVTTIYSAKRREKRKEYLPWVQDIFSHKKREEKDIPYQKDHTQCQSLISAWRRKNGEIDLVGSWLLRTVRE